MSNEVISTRVRLARNLKEYPFPCRLSEQGRKKVIEKAIEQLDSDNAKVYQNNAENYIKKLDTLDKQYANTIQNAKYKAILFGDRFPFRYMADDYDLKYYAAFAGCSAETMAGFETVTFLAQKIDTLHLMKMKQAMREKTLC